MAREHKTTRKVLTICAVAALAPLWAAGAAQALDWSGVPTKTITLFHPGQASWEWVLTQSDHSGAKKFRGGKACGQCHDGEESAIGKVIASGKKMEPAPPTGRPGSIDLQVQAAHDGKRLYLRLQWPAVDAKAPNSDPGTAARVTVMLDDGKLIEATRAGCWGACHADLPGMAHQGGGKLSKYLMASRASMSRKGGGAVKAAGDLGALRQSGTFLEYWQARLNPGKLAKAVHGYILDARHEYKSPAVTATGGKKGGNWVVVLSRALQAGGPQFKTIEAGKTFTVGFAVHDGHAAGRYHFVSFEKTLVIGSGSADLVAVKK